MKNLHTFEEFLNESVETEMLNEDANLIATVMLLGQASIVAAAVMARAGYDTPDTKLEEWWTKWKRDRRVNKILDKLNADSEVQQFLTLPPKQQEGKWKKLIDTKLNKEDKDLLNSISRDRVKRGKI
jgi:pyridoxine/pyridoxamine 5'-phosphate oxidase